MTLGKGHAQLGPQTSLQLWIWCEGTQLLLLLQTLKIILQAPKPFLSQDDREAHSQYFNKMLLAVFITPKQVSLILGVTAVISSWVNTPQQHLAKLKCNTFGELDRSAIPLPTPFKTILLSHKRQMEPKVKRELKKRNKIYYKIFWQILDCQKLFFYNAKITVLFQHCARKDIITNPNKVDEALEWQNSCYVKILSTFTVTQHCFQC